MKLSEVLKDWPEKKEPKDIQYNSEIWHNKGFNTALTSCDREIDREALARMLNMVVNVDEFISTMPTWLKRIEDK